MPIIGVNCEDKVISFDKCLACAKTLDNKCNFTPEVVKAILENLNQDDFLNLRTTNILDCPRSVYLEAKNDYTIKLDDMYYAFRGSLMHSLLESTKIHRKAIVEKRFSKTIEGFIITGKPDYILPSKSYLRDYKTCAEVPRYNKPWQNHINQFNIYRWLLTPEIEITNGEIVYLSMSHMKRIKVPKEKMISFDDIEKGIVAVAKVLKKAFETGTPPPVPDEFPKYWKCKGGYCDVADICFREFQKGR